MKKLNWKQIQQIVDKYTGKESIPESFSVPKISPIVAHSPTYPVSLRKEVSQFAELFLDKKGEYSYVCSLIKKNNIYRIAIQAYLHSPHGEIPVLFEEQEYSLSEKSQAIRQLREPFAIFNKTSDINIITFKNSDMTEEQFNDLIELWRIQQT